jgi:hypothetical protein
MNVPKLSRSQILRLAEQEDNTSVAACNPRRLLKKKRALTLSNESDIARDSKKALASASSK